MVPPGLRKLVERQLGNVLSGPCQFKASTWVLPHPGLRSGIGGQGSSIAVGYQAVEELFGLPPLWRRFELREVLMSGPFLVVLKDSTPDLIFLLSGCVTHPFPSDDTDMTSSEVFVAEELKLVHCKAGLTVEIPGTLTLILGGDHHLMAQWETFTKCHTKMIENASLKEWKKKEMETKHLEYQLAIREKDFLKQKTEMERMVERNQDLVTDFDLKARADNEFLESKHAENEKLRRIIVDQSAENDHLKSRLQSQGMDLSNLMKTKAENESRIKSLDRKLQEVASDIHSSNCTPDRLLSELIEMRTTSQVRGTELNVIRKENTDLRKKRIQDYEQYDQKLATMQKVFRMKDAMMYARLKLAFMEAKEIYFKTAWHLTDRDRAEFLAELDVLKQSSKKYWVNAKVTLLDQRSELMEQILRKYYRENEQTMEFSAESGIYPVSGIGCDGPDFESHDLKLWMAHLEDFGCIIEGNEYTNPIHGFILEGRDEVMGIATNDVDGDLRKILETTIDSVHRKRGTLDDLTDDQPPPLLVPYPVYRAALDQKTLFDDAHLYRRGADD